MIRATLTYECVEDGETQTATITVERDGTDGHCRIAFDPGLDDDTSDPCGLLSTLIQTHCGLTGQNAV